MTCRFISFKQLKKQIKKGKIWVRIKKEKIEVGKKKEKGFTLGFTITNQRVHSKWKEKQRVHNNMLTTKEGFLSKTFVVEKKLKETFQFLRFSPLL